MAKFNILVTVYYPPTKLGERRKAFSRVVETDTSLTFPFNKLCDVFRLMYSDSCIIEFSVFGDSFNAP